MKSFAKLYLSYLETVLIGIILVILTLIVVSGFIYGRNGLLPAALAVVTLGAVAYVSLGRSRALRAHPELRTKVFKESRLFYFALNGQILKITSSHPSGPLLDSLSRKQAIPQILSRITSITVAALAIWVIWSSFSISANMAQQESLEKGQAVVSAGLGIPATVFNKSVVIELIEISSETTFRVTAVVRSQGYPEMKIEGAGVGYETTYVTRSRFNIRIQKIDSTSAEFFVERIAN